MDFLDLSLRKRRVLILIYIENYQNYTIYQNKTSDFIFNLTMILCVPKITGTFKKIITEKRELHRLLLNPVNFHSDKTEN